MIGGLTARSKPLLPDFSDLIAAEEAQLRASRRARRGCRPVRWQPALYFDRPPGGHTVVTPMTAPHRPSRGRLCNECLFVSCVSPPRRVIELCSLLFAFLFALPGPSRTQCNTARIEPQNMTSSPDAEGLVLQWMPNDNALISFHAAREPPGVIRPLRMMSHGPRLSAMRCLSLICTSSNLNLNRSESR